MSGSNDYRAKVRDAFTADPSVANSIALLDEFEEMRRKLLAQERPDRSALLRMAGNIAGGLVAKSYTDDAKTAEKAISMATEIMRQIDTRS
jgi:hypothetical protein